MSVADVGAGEGYYTVRLAPLVGADGRVLAQDIVPETRDALAQRVTRERLDNVAVKLGEPNDPMLDRKSDVYGKSVSVRVDLGGRSIINKKNKRCDLSPHTQELMTFTRFLLTSTGSIYLE